MESGGAWVDFRASQGETMLTIVSFVAGIVSLICAIITLIKLFQEKGALHGILGIFCGLYPLIWGWMNVKRHNSMGVMLGWTIAIVISIGANVMQAIAIANDM